MNKRDEFKNLWRECFDDSPEWVEMFFTRVYNDDDVIALTTEKTIVSAMLLQRYKINFHGTATDMSYICGAATHRNERGKGHMSRLIESALAESYRRGDTFCSLIPAERHLYPFYARKGFATVFYVRDLRFTAVHNFITDDDFRLIDDIYAPAVYDAFSDMEYRINGNILHSHRDFLNILDDYRASHNQVAAVCDEEGHVAAIGFADISDNIATVTELLGENDDAKIAVLGKLKAQFADLPVRIRCHAGSYSQGLTPYGMCRIVNAANALRIIAAVHPDLRTTIRISDPIIPDNNHTFHIKSGNMTIDNKSTSRPDVDVDADVFTRIIWSEPAVGKLVGLPSCRPHMSLMLE